MYGAFPLFEALFGVGAVERNSSYTAAAGRAGGASTDGNTSYLDYGAAAVRLLTSCDTGEGSAGGFGSWCGMIRQGATCAMEAWNQRQKPNLSFSHPGATAALIAIVQGLMGIRPTSPAYSTFVVQPQPGAIQSARIRTPTLRGWIEVSFSTEAFGPTGIAVLTVNVTIPANTVGTVCVPDAYAEVQGDSGGDHAEFPPRLWLDGTLVAATTRVGYLCAERLGATGRPRAVRCAKPAADLGR